MLSSVLGMAVAVTAPASLAGMGAEENINLYGWQNWSYEFVDAEDGRDYDRMSNNAANIGFMSHMDTGLPGLQVGLRCEQFTDWGGRHNSRGNWCNRNSKISLRHETMGEIMFAQWLLPYNEGVAAWVDPFYDAGKDSHTSIMGNMGDSASNQSFTSMYYNGSYDREFGDAFGALSFNRRQEGIVQYVWPNSAAMASQTRNGFQFRFAITDGEAASGAPGYASGVDEVPVGARPTADGTGHIGASKTDPRIWSTNVSYQKDISDAGRIWLALGYEQHDDVSAATLANESVCDDSEDTAYHIAARYSHDWGNGQNSWLAVMYEELDYDADDCVMNTGTVATGASANSVATPIWSGVERDAWMISGKHAFGNGFDVRFSYMDADDWDCDSNVEAALAGLGAGALIGNTNSCDDTSADAYNVGLFYTMPAGTELRLTYTDLSNDDNAEYDLLFNTDAIKGEDIDMLAVGIVHWFD